MPSVLKLVFNVVGLLSNVYALRNIHSAAAFENPYALGFGGQYQVQQQQQEIIGV
jgi:hypothetical protein